MKTVEVLKYFIYHLYNTTEFKDPGGAKVLMMPIEMFNMMYDLATARYPKNDLKCAIYEYVMTKAMRDFHARTSVQVS